MSRATAQAAYDLPIAIAGDVQIIGGLHPEDEKLVRCRINTNGPRSVLSVLDRERRRFRSVDALRDPSAVQLRDGTVEITGMSEQLHDEVGMTPSESTVTWRVTLRKCASCG